MATEKQFKKILLLPGVLIACLLGFVGYVSAQSDLSKGPDELVITTTPDFPGPNEEVTLRIFYYLSDLNKADIAWVVDGEEANRQRGLRTFTVTTKDVGEPTEVQAVVRTAEGATLRETVNLIPASVDLLWEAQTHTPVFYRGKALPSSESAVVVSAFHNFQTASGKRVDTEDLVFKWQQDGSNLTDQSGPGRDRIVIEAAPLLGETTIEVRARTFDGSMTATRSIDIRSVAPDIVFYEQTPLGLSSEALTSSVTLDGGEAIVQAEPYYFSLEDLVGGLDFSWTINGQPATPDASDPRIIRLRIGPNTPASGNAELELEIKNRDKILQFDDASLDIAF